MDESGPAVAWIIILFTLGVGGLLWVMLSPVFDVFVGLGYVGTNEGTIEMLQNTWDIYAPLTIVFSLIIYGYRKSGSRVS